MRPATVQTAARTPEEVGDDAGQQGADGEPAVAPQPVDPDGACPPGRVGDVTDLAAGGSGRPSYL